MKHFVNIGLIFRSVHTTPRRVRPAKAWSGCVTFPNIPQNATASVAILALVSFSMVAVVLRERRREREAYYRSETLKRLAAAQPADGQFALEFFREEQKAASQRRRESLKLAGMITVATAVGLMAFIGTVGAHHAYPVGLIPLLIGASLLTYAYLLVPKE